MTITTITSLMPRLLGGALLLTLCACEPHDAETTRAFWDPHYEHQLHAQHVIPDYARLYYEGAPQDPVLRTNQGDPADYQSIFRGRDQKFPLNLARNAHFPPAEHHGDDHGHHADTHHGEDHGYEKSHGAPAPAHDGASSGGSFFPPAQPAAPQPSGH